ncbi:DUF192 domain-containing protein [Jannaschia formosa]|uniref:DUF192 domain-containing protein n=1 Tax=Jannaschia formosa TaxID=2259592 RepID=UPI000E1BD0A5|nr:DUF192 domain-containing protein [Jannaschia formosa]TFL17077.1 DUF192 domain-containing protein [Jannaschia formosa]
MIRAALAVLALAGPAAASCDPGHVDLRGDFGTVRFRVELALTPQEQARGLMHREEMARMAGMLFVYDRQQPLSFWMRNTLIPLDMIFLDETGTVINIHPDAVPLDETPIRSEAPGLAVLEINGGMAETLGLGPGDELRSPAMPQDLAAWPCD